VQDAASLLVLLSLQDPPLLAVDQLFVSEVRALVLCRLDGLDSPTVAAVLNAAVRLGCSPSRRGTTGAMPSRMWAASMLAK
jgi:hypothetical protein